MFARSRETQWLTFSSISTTASQHFRVSESAINWMSTGFLFAFCVASPVVILTLNKGGPKPAIITTATLLLVGNWIRYAGTKAQGGIFGVAMFGQILIGLAQPFCLSAPTRYSDLWFSDQGRISATAVATLANPLGAALGQLINSFWATNPEQVPDMVLYISIIVGASSIPSAGVNCHAVPVVVKQPISAAILMTSIIDRQPSHQSHHSSFQPHPQHPQVLHQRAVKHPSGRRSFSSSKPSSSGSS
jgi:MFS family permease